MIYTVALNTSWLSEDTLIKEVYDYFSDKEEIQFDTETNGFDPHVNKLICFQLGDKENQFVINPELIDNFKELLESKLLIMHNAKFDLKFLYKHNIIPTKVWDTYLAECVIYSGLNRRKGLDFLLKDRLGISVNKDIRDKIWEKGLTKEVINYAGTDVMYLQDLKESQIKDLEEKDLMRTIYLENSFVPVLAYIEFCGFKLDEKKWKKKCINDAIEYKKAKEELDQFILDNGYTQFIDQQLDLFSENKVVTINWASPLQVAEFFKFLKIPIVFEKHGEVKESVGEKNIAKFAKDFPVIDIYLRYKGYEKLVGTYGENFFNYINPVTGRIHTQFKQMMDTGRLSSGGKNSATGEDYPNFQNIPSDKETRSCFIAEEGNTLLISDYSGQEQIVLANKSMDENLLKFYDDGLEDMHSFVASKMFKELADMPYEEIQHNHKDKRYQAKTAGFAINYGGNGSTIARNNNLSEEEGNFIYETYFKAFPGLKNYFKKVQSQALKDGYILISERTGRKCFIENFDEFNKTRDQFNDKFWSEYRRLREINSKDFLPLKEKVSKWFSLKGSIERMALNYPIQGSSAEITKISCIYFFRWIVENKLFNIVKFVNTIHDENVIESPKHLEEECYINLKDAMLRAGSLYCKRVPLLANPEPSKFWKK